MAVISPLNHLVTDLSQPGQSTPKILEENIASLKWKSFAYGTLEKICYVALLAIVATVFAVSYNLVAMTGAMPVAVLGLVLSIPLLILAPTKLAQSAKYYSNLAETESQVYLRYREIEHWTPTQIEQFMIEKGLQPNLLPLDALRSLNPNEPVKEILPLIARFCTLREKVDRLREEERRALPALEENFARRETELGHAIEPQVKQKNRFETKSTYELLLEMEAIPAALKAAVLLQMMQNPTDVELEISPTLEIPKIGTCVPRFYAERQFGKTYGDDNYFVFNDSNRAPITHQAIVDRQMDPVALRQLLFPTAIRA